jgi:hypothetical protein
MSLSHNKTPWNPSRKATARVRDPQPVPVQCIYCLDVVEIRHHDKVYGKAYGEWPWMYVCVGCGARVGMHPFTAIPLGTLADEATREARKVCKPAFEHLWLDAGFERSGAYVWLADKLVLTAEQCHFGLFDIETCRRAKLACDGYGKAQP